MKTNHLVYSALFAALTAVLSQIAIPIGPVPINLATFSVFCAGAILGAKFGMLSQLVYILLGAVGAPVFSMFRGGPGVLFGPTGGYIMGYAVAAFLVGLISKKLSGKGYRYILAMTAGFISCMTIGTVWFMFITKNDLMSSLMVCVVPFLFGDTLKILLAALVASRVEGKITV